MYSPEATAGHTLEQLSGCQQKGKPCCVNRSRLTITDHGGAFTLNQPNLGRMLSFQLPALPLWPQERKEERQEGVKLIEQGRTWVEVLG